MPACLPRWNAIHCVVTSRGTARLAFATFWLLGWRAALAAEPPKTGIEPLMDSSVCVVGDVANGSFESSGFVVPPGDTVMTTAHGIGAASNLRVKLHDGRVFAARLERLGNERADIALLHVTGAKLPPTRLGSVGDLHAGEEVLTIGCPLGFEFSVTSGVVSSLRPSDLGYPLIQTDVPVNPGSSGGPLFDSNGRVVGIIKSTAAGRQRLNFALPIDLGRALLDHVSRDRQAYELFNQGVLEGKLDDKVDLYRKALALEPDLFEARYNLALVLERLGKIEDAEAEYRETLRLRPAHAPAALNLGAALYQQKRYRDSIDVYRQALARDPRSVALRNNLAEAYRAAGDWESSRREFEAILKEDPSYAPAHYGLGVLYDDESHDRKRAVEHYRRYLALAPEAADAQRVRGWLEQAEQAGRSSP